MTFLGCILLYHIWSGVGGVISRFGLYGIYGGITNTASTWDFGLEANDFLQDLMTLIYPQIAYLEPVLFRLAHACNSY